MKVLVTGGAGFIGSNLARYLLREHHHIEVTVLDKLTYAGNLENLAEAEESPRYRFVRGDVADPAAVEEALSPDFDAIIHVAAETHVDRSLEDPAPFLRTNVMGTHLLLEEARRRNIKRFVHVSTDEVYGSAPDGICFAEDASLQPTSPYAASKAAADLLVLSYVRSYGFPAVILRCTNNYGPYQFPEKLIPLMIANALEDKPLPVYGDGLQVRDWIYVEDHCRAISLALARGRTAEVYNIASGSSRTNLEVVRALLKLLGKPESLITFVEDRPAHDHRYALDATKARTELGWSPRCRLEEGLALTVQWNRSHAAWLERCRTGSYRDYYDRHYLNRAETLRHWNPHR